RFGRRPVFVVSNREPVSHVRDGRVVREQEPASGLVTALEPIMQACGGVWVAHGSGNADREVGERIGLPSADPAYTLRRVWLSDEEEAGYYYGFTNEGLWPLCHIVHERPRFRAADWGHYRAVNERFAKALLQEMEAVEAPIVLVQDYHFALLPRLVKEARPDARVALFWHIPWPNFEAVGICPWQSDILLGMLGADLVGFRTQFSCTNSLEPVARATEGRLDWGRSRIARYQAVQEETREMVRALNADLGERGWQPIVYRERHHDRREIYGFYRLADFCMVTSLHDGMNLVAKEFVAARDDDDGVL